MLDRTPEDHPHERVSDQGWRARLAYWWGPGRGYRDVWIFISTGLVLLALVLNQDRVDDIQQSRSDLTSSTCAKDNETITRVNETFRYIQGIIVGGSALPGDFIDPAGEENPLKWRSIDPGPLSQQIQKQFPAFPSAQQRFEKSKDRAAELEEKKVAQRDCAAEVKAVQESGEGG